MIPESSVGGGEFGQKYKNEGGFHAAPGETNLLVRDGGLLLIGQLHARAHVRPQVCFAAYQQHASAGAEILNLSFPLRTDEHR